MENVDSREFFPTTGNTVKFLQYLKKIEREDKYVKNSKNWNKEPADRYLQRRKAVNIFQTSCPDDVRFLQ